MKRIITLAALALAALSASATTCKNGGTNWPTCTPPSTPAPAPTPSTLNVSPTSSSNSISGAVSSSSAQAGATSSLSGTLTAAGGAGGAGGSLSFDEFGRQNLYVLPAPVQAAPLPPGLCPQGDSISVGILWNLFSFSQSSTRTEMQCLKEVLAAIKPVAQVQTTLAPLTSVEKATLERLDRESRDRAASSAASVPASTTPAPSAASAATKGKKVVSKKPAQKKAEPLPDCGADGVLQCRPKKQT